MELDSQTPIDTENQGEESDPSASNENETQSLQSDRLSKHKDADDNDDSLSYYISMSG